MLGSRGCGRSAKPQLSLTVPYTKTVRPAKTHHGSLPGANNRQLSAFTKPATASAISMKSVADRLAPPTSAPSTLFGASTSAALPVSPIRHRECASWRQYRQSAWSALREWHRAWLRYHRPLASAGSDRPDRFIGNHGILGGRAIGYRSSDLAGNDSNLLPASRSSLVSPTQTTAQSPARQAPASVRERQHRSPYDRCGVPNVRLKHSLHPDRTAFQGRYRQCVRHFPPDGRFDRQYEWAAVSMVFTASAIKRGRRTHEHVDPFQDAFLGAGFQGINGVDAAAQTVHFPIARNKRTNTVGWHESFQMFDGDGGLLAGLPPLLNQQSLPARRLGCACTAPKG
jgi:hypothetical protein